MVARQILALPDRVRISAFQRIKNKKMEKKNAQTECTMLNGTKHSH